MTQNAQHLSWTRPEVDRRLHEIMKAIHEQAYNAAIEYGFPGNYVVGANIAGFLKVADAMVEQGLVWTAIALCVHMLAEWARLACAAGHARMRGARDTVRSSCGEVAGCVVI